DWSDSIACRLPRLHAEERSADVTSAPDLCGTESEILNGRTGWRQDGPDRQDGKNRVFPSCPSSLSCPSRRLLLAEVLNECEVDEVLSRRVRLGVLLIERLDVLRECLGENRRHRVIGALYRRIDDEHIEHVSAGGGFRRLEHFPARGLLLALRLRA